MPDDITQKIEARKFLKAALFFLSPFVLALAFPVFVFWTAGEFTAPDDVILAQRSTQSVLYGAAYTDCSVYYKLASVLARHPQVIALGSSRIMQFRSGFFEHPESFFNVGGAANKTKQFSYFLDKIPAGQEPKVVIVGLDQFIFSHGWDDLVYNEPPEKYARCENPSNSFFAQWKTVYRDFFQHKFSLADLAPTGDTALKRIGLNALVKDNGFRNDGSYHYGKIIKERLGSKEPTFIDDFDKIKNQDKLYVVDSEVNAIAVASVEDFLKKSKTRGVHVVGFLPPYAPSVYVRLKADKESFSYVFKLEPKLQPLFEKYGFHLFDFSDASLMGATDEEMIDGIHGSEKTYLRILIEMAKTDSILNSYVSSVDLKEQLKEARPLEVF